MEKSRAREGGGAGGGGGKALARVAACLRHSSEAHILVIGVLAKPSTHHGFPNSAVRIETQRHCMLQTYMSFCASMCQDRQLWTLINYTRDLAVILHDVFHHVFQMLCFALVHPTRT